MKTMIRSLMCAAVMLSVLWARIPAVRADSTDDYINQIYQDQQDLTNYLDSITQTNDYVNQINESVQQTQDYMAQVNDAATDGNFSGPGGGTIHFSGNLINGGYYYNRPR